MPPEDQNNPPVHVQVTLARIEETLRFVQRDIQDIKQHGTDTSQDLFVRVNGLERWKAETDGALKILARAQSILYIVFVIGMLLGGFDAVKALTGHP